MPVKIRLARTGRKKVARYRIVAADSRVQRDGRFIETLGTYDPQDQPKAYNLNNERMAYWLNEGATPTLTVKNILRQDRFAERMEAMKKGLDPAEANIDARPERKRKPKTVKAKKGS